MIVYYTGTGNSRYCAQALSDHLKDSLVGAFPFIRGGKPAELTSERPWVFVAPTYSWRLPRVFRDFIRSSHFSGSQDAYFVLTCGEDIGNAAAYHQALCLEKGLRCRGTLPIVMPENYIAMFSAPSPDQARSILAAARPILEQCAAWIRDNRDFPPIKAHALDRLKSGMINTLFYQFNVKASPFTVSENCISCGKCESVCPLGNIHMSNGKPVWGSHCTHCMACICGCPAEAIEYGRKSIGKPRYQCPPYQG